MLPTRRTLSLALLAVLGAPAHAQSNSTVQLEPFIFTPLPLGSVKPLGWLNDQLQLMANGLAGHEMDFFPVVTDNRWIGGDFDYSDLNEGLPYWFNGLVGLAYALDDDRLLGQVANVSNYVLNAQQDNGWLGPETTYNSTNLWGRFPMSLGLMQLAQANSSMTDQIVAALYKFIPLMDGMLEDGASPNEDWGRARYADMNLVMQWLYESHPNDNTSVLIETMTRWQQHGVDWAGYYTQANYLFNDIDSYSNATQVADFALLHGVNVAQGLKTMGVNYRFMSDDSLIQVSHDAVNWTFTYHGAPSGSVLGDERETSLQPLHGSELCTTVETMYSLSYLYHLFGEPFYADRAELAAFNALPTMTTPDWWAHQYIALPNQPFANTVPENAGLWWNTQPDAISFGLEPDYPCCAVNHPQGWPKYLQAMFTGAGDNGLANTLLGPATVTTTLGDGTQVTVGTNTTYPFTPVIAYTIQASGSFTFYVRVPAWQTATPTVAINGATASLAAADDHGMLAIPIPSGASTVTYTLAPEIVLEHRGNDTVAVHHGALLYALDLGQDVTTAAPADPSTPTTAQTVFYNNTQPWNLAINISSLQYFGPDAANASSVTLPNPLFDYQAPPTYITAQACEISWDLFNGVPGPVPLDGSRNCTADPVTVTLRPYGSVRARMAELPILGT